MQAVSALFEALTCAVIGFFLAITMLGGWEFLWESITK